MTESAHQGRLPLSSNSLQERLRHLYCDASPESYRFRYALIVFDITTVTFIVVTSFLPRYRIIEWFDAIFGVLILADVAARLFISRTRLRDLANPITWADIIAIVSFMAPITGEGGGFLRILRTLRLLHTYELLNRLRTDSRWFRQNEEVAITLVHFSVFLFVMSAIVYETQHLTNPEIKNYVDALYFTVTALTTTGFGDITLPGTVGRVISIVIMLLGVTLFLRLARAILRPYKVRYPCPTCGLVRHDMDAVHCKACGTVLNIPDEGAV